MSWERESVIWAAGLFEGEGCWTHKNHKYVVSDLRMTDEDSVRRYAAVFDLTVCGPYRNTVKGEYVGKPFWSAIATNWEKIQAMGAAMWPWLGERRRARWLEVLAMQPTRPTRGPRKGPQ